MAEPRTVADAYSRTGVAWEDGPGRVYGRLAEVLVGTSPVPLLGLRVLDLGAGTGAASAAIRAAGGHPIAADVAPGMLRAIAEPRPPAVAADALALPFRSDSLDAVVAAFSLNHLDDPTAGLREASRVTIQGGAILASAYATDDSHPAKQAVEESARELGWEPPRWYTELQGSAIPRLATPERMAAVAAAAGLDADVRTLRVPFPHLTVTDLVAWRLGMAQLSPFLESLPPGARDDLARRAASRLGGHTPTLVRSIVVLVATTV